MQEGELPLGAWRVENGAIVGLLERGAQLSRDFRAIARTFGGFGRRCIGIVPSHGILEQRVELLVLTQALEHVVHDEPALDGVDLTVLLPRRDLRLP